MREVLLGVGALGAAVTGGVFLAFSVLVLPGLARLVDPRVAVPAMQEINAVAARSSFLVLLFGTAAVAVWLGVLGVGRLPSAGGWLTAAGSVVFLLGAGVWTIAFHVPMNDALATVGPGDDAASAWAAFGPRWTVGNHVRTVSGVAAAVLYAVAARVG